jgi:hypothetical protein
MTPLWKPRAAVAARGLGRYPRSRPRQPPDVEYLVFDDEGHGFTSRDNDIKARTAVVDFLTSHLGNWPAPARLPVPRLTGNGLQVGQD